MIARTMTCTSCNNQVLERFTNEEYSEYLQNKKRAERQGIELGWFCVNCSDKMCVMCRNGVVVNYIPAQEQGEIRKKIPTCQNCFDKFKRQLSNSDEIDPKQLEHLPNVTHEEWQEFIEKINQKD